MSNDTNVTLLDRAKDMIDEWAGTLWAELIQKDIDTNNLESLSNHVHLAEAEVSMREFSDVE